MNLFLLPLIFAFYFKLAGPVARLDPTAVEPSNFYSDAGEIAKELNKPLLDFLGNVISSKG